MSPEKTPFTAPTPDKPATAPRELIEMPDWNKQKPEQVESAESLIGDAENLDLDAQGRLELMTGFIESIEALARSGDIKNGSGESYSLDKVREQLSELVQELNNPTEGFNPTLLIPRSNGLRSTIDSLLTNESTASALIDAINARGMEVTGKLKAVESLGGEAVKAADIINPSDSVESNRESQSETERLEQSMDEIRKALSESDRAAVWSYATALYENEMGNARDKMSPEVRASHIPGDMAELYRQLKKARDSQ